MTDTSPERKARTADVRPLEDVDFAALTFHPQVLDGLRKSGFERPSPIQLRGIPLGRCGLDLIVQAKSGTGKTCVFTIVALESLDMSSKRVQVLVLAPTREIAVQIQQVVMSIGCSLAGLKCHVFIGGLPVSIDRQNLSKCHIAVGTPGRIKQLIEWQLLQTDGVRLLVLDEADKLLEEGSFQEQINWIYSTLPENKQMIAASATYPEALAEHVTKYMHNPTMVRLNAADPSLLGIKQFKKVLPAQPSLHLAYDVKVKHLLTFLTQVSFHQCLIFSNLQTRAENLSHLLCTRGWPSRYISGSQDQQLRLSVMSDLRASQCRILVATDLISRGIDVDKVNLVINLDVPKDYETYLHRIGRAGRFGSHGLALTYVAAADENAALRRLLANARTPVLDLPGVLPANLVDRPPLRQSDGGGDIPAGSFEVVETFQLTSNADVAANGSNVSATDEPIDKASTGSSAAGPAPRRGNRSQQRQQRREQPKQQAAPLPQQRLRDGNDNTVASSSQQLRSDAGDLGMEVAAGNVWDIVSTIRQYASQTDGSGCTKLSTGGDAAEVQGGVGDSCDGDVSPSFCASSPTAPPALPESAEYRVHLDLAPDDQYSALCRAVDNYLSLALCPSRGDDRQMAPSSPIATGNQSLNAAVQKKVSLADESATGIGESELIPCDALGRQPTIPTSRSLPARGEVRIPDALFGAPSSDLRSGVLLPMKGAVCEQMILKKPRREQQTSSRLEHHSLMTPSPRADCGGADVVGDDVPSNELANSSASRAIICSRSLPDAALGVLSDVRPSPVSSERVASSESPAVSENEAESESEAESENEAESSCLDSDDSSSDNEMYRCPNVLGPVRSAVSAPSVPFCGDRLMQHYMTFAAADMYLREMCAANFKNKGT